MGMACASDGLGAVEMAVLLQWNRAFKREMRSRHESGQERSRLSTGEDAEPGTGPGSLRAAGPLGATEDGILYVLRLYYSSLNHNWSVRWAALVFCHHEQHCSRRLRATINNWRFYFCKIGSPSSKTWPNLRICALFL